MEFQYNRDKQTVINVLKRKAEKKNLKVNNNQEKVEVSLEAGRFNNGEDYIPVTFKGKISDVDSGSVKGRILLRILSLYFSHSSSYTYCSKICLVCYRQADGKYYIVWYCYCFTSYCCDSGYGEIKESERNYSRLFK